MLSTFVIGSIAVCIVWWVALLAANPTRSRKPVRKAKERHRIEDEWFESDPDTVPARKPKSSARSYRNAAGRAGEDQVANTLKGMGVEALHDLRIPHQGGGAQIDHIALVGQTLLVLETKNFSGSLRASFDASHWEKVRVGQPPSRIYNPLKQNQKHAEVVRSKVGSIEVHPLVVLVGNVRLEADDDLEDIIFLEELRPLLELHARRAATPGAKAAFDALGRYAQGR